MKNGREIPQPLLGAIGAVVTIGSALLICVAFDARTFSTWVAFLIMSIVPAQTIVDLVWKNSYPPALVRLPQPFKGITILATLVVVGCVTVPLTLKLVGGSVTPPIPFLNIYMILSILATFWLVAVFQCWPFSAISSKPAVIGVGTMVLAYLLAWLVFTAGFDFGVMERAPFYLASLDPQGAFPVWSIFSYLVTTVAVIMALVLFDFWSFTGLTEKATLFTRQPYFGLLVALFVLIASAIIWTAAVHWAGMDRVDFMVRIPISFLLGNFILLILFQTVPFHKMAQPVKGIYLNVFSIILAILAYSIYRYVALAVVGDLSAGPPTYALDLWVAAAMLSITLPVIVAYAGAFGCWPFLRKKLT